MRKSRFFVILNRSNYRENSSFDVLAMKTFIRVFVKKYSKLLLNSFCYIENSFEFFLNVPIYGMKTDGEKLKEFFLHEKEMKMRKFEKNLPRITMQHF